MEQNSGPGKAPAERVPERHPAPNARALLGRREDPYRAGGAARRGEYLLALPPRRHRRLDVLRVVQGVPGSLERGLAIATELHDFTQQLHFLARLNTFLYRTGDFRGALAVARQARTISRRHNIPAGQVTAEWMLGVAYHCVGSQDAAQRHCQRGFAHSKNYAVHDPSFFGYDHRVRALVGLGGTLWLRGYANRATSGSAQ